MKEMSVENGHCKSVVLPENNLKRDVCGGSFSSGSDSGVDSSDEGIKILDSDLGKRIISQVEAYFSDENLEKDAFLLKHIKRNKEGYVNIKLIASLRKVKSVCKDWKVIASAIRQYSQQLIINDEVNKVRRTTPYIFPEKQTRIQQKNHISSNGKKVLLVNIPSGASKESDVTALLQDVSQPRTVEICKGEVHPLLGVEWSSLLPEIRSNPYALIEFDSEKTALQVVKQLELNARLNWRQTMKAFLLSSPPSVTVTEVNSGRPPLLTRQRSRTMNEVSLQDKRQFPLIQRNKSGSCTSIDLGRRSSCLITEPTVVVVRQPVGPDGSRGFCARIS